MKTPIKDPTFPLVVPIDDETRAMLAYAASPEGRAKIENARQELRDGKGIPVTVELFDQLERRVANE